jgi:hypothetical protein
MSKQNIQDRYHGRNDPVAHKIMSTHAVNQGLKPPADETIVGSSRSIMHYLVLTRPPRLPCFLRRSRQTPRRTQFAHKSSTPCLVWMLLNCAPSFMLRNRSQPISSSIHLRRTNRNILDVLSSISRSVRQPRLRLKHGQMASIWAGPRRASNGAGRRRLRRQLQL